MSRYNDRLPHDYKAAADMLNGRETRPVPGVGNTHLTQGDGYIDLTYHGNMIASFDQDTGDVLLTTAGWATRSTHERLNAIARTVGVVFSIQGGEGVITGPGAYSLASSEEFGVTIHDLGWILDWELTERKEYAA